MASPMVVGKGLEACGVFYPAQATGEVWGAGAGKLGVVGVGFVVVVAGKGGFAILWNEMGFFQEAIGLVIGAVDGFSLGIVTCGLTLVINKSVG